MDFQNPTALLLLVLLIPTAWIGWPTRGYGRSRELAALILRSAILILLVLAAAGLQLRRGTDALAVVFLVDASDSMPPESEAAAAAFIERALAEMEPQDQAAVVVFGGEALVDRPMSPGNILARITSIPDTSRTDLAGAIRMGMALFPTEAARRIVLLSDGRATEGDAGSAARLAVQSGIDFLAVDLGAGDQGQEVTLLNVDLPDTLIEGETFNLVFTVHARAAASAVVRIVAGGAVVFEGAADLKAGSQTFRIPLVAGESGFTPYSVQITAAADTHIQNNKLAAFTRITGPPKVLVIAPPAGEPLPGSGEPRPDETSRLVEALETAGFPVDLARPSGLPFELALLSDYASVVLVDVPARELTNRQMSALQSYVRDLGGGLVAVGGPTSYGVGGYYRTALEETLPVDMEIKDQARRPTLTMVFIIDHSGSMGETNAGFTKLDLAKEAAIRSVDLLFPGDRIGVITFDDSASWVVPITDLSDPGAVQRAIETIGIGGGTDILAGLQAMADVLPADPSLVKHVILLTDGGASPTGIPELVESLYTEHGITLTTVGVGTDAAPFLQDIALLGGGRYHFTDRPESIPSIFTEETTLATRSYIVEETFFPALASRSTILGSIDQVPLLHGYVAATAKETAQTILVSELGDPILAAWQFGLGKAVAWTSDASPRWARDWVAWEEFPNFWAQIVRFTVTERSTSPLRVRIDHDGSATAVTIDAVTETGGFLNNLQVTANVVDPDGRVIQLPVPQTAPGQYRAVFQPDLEGVYLLRFDGFDPATGESVSEIAGWVRSYSPEYRLTGEGGGGLARLVDASGGALLPTAEASTVFERPESLAAAGRLLWPELLTAAMLLLPLDIAVRRLVLERRDAARVWAAVRARFRLQPAGAGALNTRSEQVAGLLRAKERSAERARERADSAELPQEGRAAPDRKTHSEKPAILAEPGAAMQTEADAAREGDPAPAGDDQPAPTSTTAALLARKRAREKGRKR